jgi:hypothetical protein
MVRSRVAVRDVNDEFAVTIAAKLPPDDAARFTQTYRLRGYARVFHSTHTHRLFSAARGLTGLEAAQVQAVADLEQSYLSELAAVNEDFLATVRQHEPAELTRQAERPRRRAESGASTRGDEADAIPRQQERQRDLSVRFAEQLQVLLGPEQWKRIPGSDITKSRSTDHGDAQNPNREPRPPRSKLTEKFDTDGDGRLSQAEREALLEELRERRAGHSPAGDAQ